MEIHENYSLQKYNTFGIDVSARYFSAFSSAEELLELLARPSQGETMVLGGGSNVLFTKDFDGLVLKNDIPGIDMVGADEEHIFIRAGAGVAWHSLVTFCVNNNWGGLENLSLIPGNVGASPMQNIGAYGVEIKDVFFELEALHLMDRSIHKFSSPDCAFGYRDSIFKNRYKNQFVILNVTYRLKKNPVLNISYGAIQQELERMKIREVTIKAVSDAVISIRTLKLPDLALLGNAGSFFKNPVLDQRSFEHLREQMGGEVFPYYEDNGHYKIPAGWLIEKCGWKGVRKGDAGCYDKQALVLVNYGNATGMEIYELSEEIKRSVEKKFNIVLEREVNVC